MSAMALLLQLLHIGAWLLLAHPESTSGVSVRTALQDAGETYDESIPVKSINIVQRVQVSHPP